MPSPLVAGPLLFVAIAGCDVGGGGTTVVSETGRAADSGPVEGVGSACDGRVHPPVVLNEFVSANLHGTLDADEETSDWIEVANLDAVPVDLAGWGLSDDEGAPLAWTFPSFELTAGGVVQVFASGKDRTGEELHTDFSIAAEGEVLLLSDPDGCPVDRVEPVRLYRDVSYGRPAEDPETWAYFQEPTPGTGNTTEWRSGFAALPGFSPEPGFYDESVTVTVSTGQAGATVRLTFDGAAPEEGDTVYTEPFEVVAEDQPVVVRARAWVDGLWPGRIATATYSEDPTILDDDLKVVSLTVDPFDLYDEETGIYAYGPPDYDPDYPYFGANFWEDWERDLHVEVWEPDGTRVLAQDAGIKIHGGYTRAFDQKNFRILARSAYGPGALDYAFFPSEPQESYKKVVLEGAGDWCPTHTENAFVDVVFRDADLQSIPSIDTQAWEPTVVYLNGQFWGLYAFREKLDEYYAQAHHGADPENLDRIECTADGTDDWWNLQQGSWDAFNAMNDFVEGADLSDPEQWAEFQTFADIENLATAVVAEGYWGNTDWWDNNLKMWREREEDAPFRWMVFDLGHSWGSYSYDHFGTSVNWSGDGLHIADALENEEFRVLLANQWSDFLNTNLAVDNALDRLDEMHARIEPVIPEQHATWCGEPASHWYADVETARQFVQKRPAVLWQQVRQHLELSGTAQVTLASEPEGAGSFTLTVVEVEPPFTGTFFTGIPVTVTAVPAAGWSFDAWSDDTLGDEATTTFTLDGDRSITAHFE